MEKKSIIEALLFSSEEPLSVSKIQSILETKDRGGIVRSIQELKEEYNDPSRGIYLAEVAGGFQLRTKPEMAQWVRKIKRQRVTRLTQAALECLAVVAYRQPVTRAEIEHIRGVDCGAVLRGLLVKGLVRILGRKDVPGRPLLYGTSKKFLEVFSLKDLSSLPDLREIEELQGSSPFNSKVTETDED